MKSLKTNLAYSFLVGGLILCNNAQSALLTAEFNWQGDGGYEVEGKFTYDDTFAMVIAKGADSGNVNNGLEYLGLKFFDPSHNLLSSVIDVQAGAVSYSFLEFTFNPSTMAFEGSFDMGKDTDALSGEYYIWGDIGGTDSFLEEVNATALDSQATPTLSVTSVPVPGALSMFLSGVFCLLGVGKRFVPACRSGACNAQA